MSDPSRYSELEMSGRDIPSFIEPRPPIVLHPFMRRRPEKGIKLFEHFEEDSECEEPDLVQVYLRLKPCNITTNLYEVRSERCLITSLDTTTAGHGRRTQHNVSKMYTFSHIFRSDSSQKDVFEHVVKENLKKLPEGHSFTLLTYGASGSGKTFTLMGTVSAPGLVPRSLEYVFNIVEAAQRPCYKPSETGAEILSNAEQDYELKWVKGLRQISAPLRDKYRRMSASLHSTITNSYIDLSNRTKNYVWVSFIEIYNEGIYDLLVPCDRRAASKLAIREDSNGDVYVKGASQAFVRSGEEAYDVMVAGKHNLQVAATGVHAQSSRSHCIFTITMLTETDGEVRSACVRLCDLAGCERAARTRNTGARMQESRAINSSLHVLERCLHTLRRRQAGRRALVPYRESKLTRLLGAGLSGARGEAVSMVVTLNPAPEYAHETRHVLQLAAVAKDIQVNNTIAEYPSSLETSQDSTLGPSAEVMRLRADNERLRFELARSEAFYKEQLARMEEQQTPAVGHCDTWALVEEAKQLTKQCYEERIQALRKQNEEKAEEHENKIAELLVSITVLEEMLSAEKLSRARAEEEVVHLRSCIEERDEKLDENEPTVHVIDVTDSETSDNEDDPFNESLEPTFKMEDINRSKVIRQSLQHETRDFDVEKSCNVSTESVLEKSRDTLKDDGSDDDSNHDSAVDSTYATSNEASGGNSNIVYQCQNVIEKKQDNEIRTQDNVFIEEHETSKTKNNDTRSTSSISRSTYSAIKDNSLYESSVEVREESDQFIKNNSSHIKETTVKKDIPKDTENFKIPDKPFVYSIINSLKKPIENNNSLTQFESLEKAANDYDSTKQKINVGIDKIKILNEKRFFFDEAKSDDTCSTKSDINMPVEYINIVKDKGSFFDCNVKCNDASATKCDVYNMAADNTNISKEKIIYIDSEIKSYGSSTDGSKYKVTNKNYYFDDTHTKFEYKIHGNIKEQFHDYRSPSIVKEECTIDFEPQRIKKLLGEDNVMAMEPKSSVKKSYFAKEHKSIDVFDSPQVQYALNELPTIDDIRKSMTKVIISNSNDVKSENNALENKNLTLQTTNQESLQKSPKLIGSDELPSIEDIRRSIASENTSLKKNKELKDQNDTQKESNLKLEVLNQVSLELSCKFEQLPSIDDIRESIAKGVISSQNKEHSIQNYTLNSMILNERTSRNKYEDNVRSVAKTTPLEASEVTNTKVDSTLEEFENIYKEITIPRCTEFDLLYTSNQNETQVIETNNTEQEYNDAENPGYNLRKTKSKTEKKPRKTRTKCLEGDVLMESLSKCESSAKFTKRNLRLRRRKNVSDEDSVEPEKEEKLKDIVNLQNEFSDITMDVPTRPKDVKIIPSPEKEEEENVCPALGIQSCPSKMSTRRRKLFTPRAEPLDESVASGDCDERVRVPRPSYHRPRARRKL